MRLMELFDSLPTTVRWKVKNDKRAVVKVQIKENKYEIVICKSAVSEFQDMLTMHDPFAKYPGWFDDIEDKSIYEIEFGIHKHNRTDIDPYTGIIDRYGITNTGHQYTLLSTTMKVMKEYAKSFHVDYWFFSATESSRKSLYDKMINRFAKGNVHTFNVGSEKYYVIGVRSFELTEAKLQPFSLDPITPNQIDMMKDPEYMAKKKGMVGSIQWMSPSEYIRACELGFKRSGSEGLVRGGRTPELIQQYAKDMKRGDKFPILELDYRNGFGQEGLHRAMAAEILGIKKVPVFITKESPEFAANRDTERNAEMDRIKQQYIPSQSDDNTLNNILSSFNESKLTEGISPIVYHYMNIRNAESVLRQNKFRLTASPGTSEDRHLQKGDRMYYLSTTRHKLGGYHIDNSMGVIFELDGRKLAQNLKGQAVDYWGDTWYGPGRKGYDKKEAEDRIYSYKPYIENANKYITAIHILFDREAQNKREHLGVDIRRMIIAAKRLGIKTYLYTRKQDWLLQNKNKAVNPATVQSVARAGGKEKDQNTYGSSSSFTRRTLSPWIELYLAPVGSNISKRAKDVRYNYVLYGYSDAPQSLATDIHNAKSKPADETGLETLLKIFRKEKIETPRQYLDLLKDKWRPKEESLNEYTEITHDTENDEGNIFGYVVDTDEEQLVTYFVYNHGISESIIDEIRSKYNTVAVARGMVVEEEYKNRGLGTELLQAFIDEAAAEGAEAILCVADAFEDNDFDLVKWYKSWGFEIITQAGSGPMMVMEL